MRGLIGLVAIYALGAFSLDALVELSVLLHHRELDLQASPYECYRKLTLSTTACDKGSGAFGHAWIWIHGIDDRGKKWDLELGHTGEEDLTQHSILEGLLQQARVYEQDATIEAIDSLFLDRWDGALEWGSGGHIPQAAFSIALTQEQLDHLWNWIESDGYGFERYNLMHHQCCHFVVEALGQVGLIFRLDPHWKVPEKLCLWNQKICLHHTQEGRDLNLLTPFYLTQILPEQAPILKPSLEAYLDAKQPCSIWPWKRFWQRKEHLKKMILYAPEQLGRLFWIQGWKEPEKASISDRS